MAEAEPPWTRSLVLAFRFAVCFYAFTTLYLAIDCLAVLFPFLQPFTDGIQDRGLFAAYEWATQQLFGPVVYATNAGFVAYFSTALIAAAAGTLIWSLIDRGRRDYRRAQVWLRVYLRYLLAAVVLGYGAAKVLPSQFVPPSLVALLTPLGDLTPMRLLWHAMGTSMLYTIFTGLAEVAGGLLLLWRRTTTLGALILTAALSNVVVLNFGYQVGVQLNSTIYLMMALTLLAPDAKRLATALLEPDASPGQTTSTNGRLVRYLKPAFVALLLVMTAREAYMNHREVWARPELYGIYDVVDFTRDGASVPPGSQERWLRLAIAERNAGAIQWAAGGRIERYTLKEDSATNAITFTGQGTPPVILTFHFKRASDSLELGGEVDGHQIAARLRMVDPTSFVLRRPR